MKGRKWRGNHTDSNRAVKRAINDSGTDDTDRDSDQEFDFIDESVRHLTIGKIKSHKLSDFECVCRLHLFVLDTHLATLLESNCPFGFLLVMFPLGSSYFVFVFLSL